MLCCIVVVTGLNKWIAVFSVGIVCIFYTTIVSFLQQPDIFVVSFDFEI